MENMNKYKKHHTKTIKEEIAVLFCPDIIYLLPETYLPRGNLMWSDVERECMCFSFGWHGNII